MSSKGWLWTLFLAAILPRAIPTHSAIITDRVDDACPFSLCYRKLEPGKKTLEVHVGRTFKCEDVDDCRRACDYERAFVCEGFNYRRTAEREFGGRCELTMTPYPRIDRPKDFVDDEHRDYYEKRPHCFYNGDGVPRVQDPRWHHDRPTEHRNGRPIFSAYPSYGNTKAVAREPEHRDRDSSYHGDSPNRLHYSRHENYPPRATPPAGTFFYPKSLERRTDQEARRNADSWKELDGRTAVYERLNPYPAADRGTAWSDERSRSRENDQFYGKFSNYGGAFGYVPRARNNVPASSEILYGETVSAAKCSVRATAGSKLARRLLRKTRLSRDLDHCEISCLTEQSFRCSSFSYRYYLLPTDPTDNCLLSDATYQDLNFYTDLEPDRNYDVYSVIEDPRICSASKSVQRDRSPSDDCFWRVRSGFGLPSDVTKKSMVASDLGECQLACTMSRDFTCRSLAITYDGTPDAQNSGANCFLSDWPSREINPGEMPDKHGAELYERGSFARGCEPYSFANLPSPYGPLSDEACYSGYHRSCKLKPHAVFSSTRVTDEPDCRRECSRTRDRGSVPCMSFSYKSTAHDTRANCFLSDVSMRDLRPELDYAHDDEHVLYAWKELDPYCQIGRYSVQTDDTVFRPIGSFPMRHDGAGVDDTASPGFDRGALGAPLYPRENSLFQIYTVNGQPCRNGSHCQRNEIAGFWSCEVEQAEYGDWDYCCEPTHHCGFSQGYRDPWCYVGPSEDQWRPCSETYYPYVLNGQRFDDRPNDHDHDHDHRHEDGARHWPIIYLHKDPPPNCTTDRFAALLESNRQSASDGRFLGGKGNLNAWTQRRRYQPLD